MKWTPFEHDIYRILQDLQGSSVLVGLSGGADSVCLANILKTFEVPLQLKIHLIHCHHGQSKDSQTQIFRDQAAQFCQNFAEKLQIPLSFKRYDDTEELNSESKMRDFRHTIFRQKKDELGFLYIATAHHQDDVLETRLMRLIRGTGLYGLEAMRFQQESMIRPLLNVSRDQILSYLHEKGLVYIEDPSNQDPGYFRNWIRNEWLKSLEVRQPGAKASLSRSLELILQEVDQRENLEFDSENLAYSSYLTLDLIQKKTLLARYIMSLGIRNYSLGHIEEIIKQLDNSDSRHRFRVCGLEWAIDAGRIRANRSKSSPSV